MIIEFEDSTQRLAGEGCSKRLKVDSDLVKYLRTIRTKIQERSSEITGSNRPWHIEVARRVDRDKLVDRAMEIDGKIVDVANSKNYLVMNQNALVLMTPEVSGYGPTHITIAYFPKGVPDWAFLFIPK